MSKKLKNVIILIAAIIYSISTLVYADNKELQTENKLNDSIAIFIGSPHALINNNQKLIDPNNIDVVPIIEKGNTLIPIRFLAESLGAKVLWNEKDKSIKINQNGKNIELKIGYTTMKIGNQTVKLNVKPKMLSTRALVPAKAIAKAFGREVFYNRGVVIISDKKDIFDVNADKELITKIIEKLDTIPTIGTKESLFTILKKVYKTNPYYRNDLAYTIKSDQNAESQVEEKQENPKDSNLDYSSTNLQVQGVDEADTVKNDSEYIYKINESKVDIIKAYPADKLQVIKSIDFKSIDESFMPSELYVDKGRLLIIGNSWINNVYDETAVEPSTNANIKIMQHKPIYSQSFVRVYSYDIEDKNNIFLAREFEIEGNYISTRKIGSNLYVLTNKDLLNYVFYDNKNELKEENIKLPMYKDSNTNNKLNEVDLKSMCYFPGSNDSNNINILSVDISDDKSDLKISSYLGSGDSVYASTKNLYIAYNDYSYINTFVKSDSYSNSSKTKIYKFKIDGTKINYLSKGEVPGTILNQFSMDEYNGAFRIATTKNVNNSTTNNVYVLNDEMVTSGKLENIANGERIYSVRFLGKRGYVVTYKQVDPLFVLDFNDDLSVKILGELKIPGYSNYMQPYDEDNIIGIGKDTTTINGNDYYLGMKMAIFNISDVNKPIEKFSENIGDRGTESEVLYNHKALLFSKSKKLLAFPINVAKIKDGVIKDTYGNPKYGQLEFQGAYIYNIDLKDGFRLMKKITHLETKDIQEAIDSYYYGNRSIERVLYINDMIYTVSKGMIKVNNLKDFEEVNSLNIEK